MHVTEVGKLFIPGRTRYNEGAYFEYSEAGPFLIFAFSWPTKEDIEAARKGRVELALYEAPPVIFILHKIRGLEQWSDSPFSIRLYDGMGKKFDWSEPIEEGQGLGLNIVLVDADTGVLLALRLVGTSTEFARELRAAILRQIEAPFSVTAYDSKINEVYTKYTSQQLLALATAQHRIQGD